MEVQRLTRRKRVQSSLRQSAEMTERGTGGTRWPFRLAVALCCAVFPLIWIGGLVTTYDAGMAVPDWPSTHGYNLFLYPWRTWIFGPWDLFLEHGHRLLASAAGVITIALVAAVFRWDRRREVRIAACVALAWIIAQGCLGGARVLLDDRQLAMVHACTGPAFFAYCAALAATLAPSWAEASRAGGHPRSRGYRRRASWCVLLIYLQLVLGAQLRHIPVAAPRWLFNVSLWLHLGNALLVAVLVVLAGWKLGRLHEEPRLRRPALLLVSLLALQIVLGAASWVVTYGWPYWLGGWGFAASQTIQANSTLQATTVTLHMAVGSLLLANSVLLWLTSRRLLGVEPAAAPGGRALPERRS